MHQIFRLLAVAGLALPIVASAQGGTITGRVTDRSTGAPVPDAQIVVVGTQRGTRTDVEGQYRQNVLPTSCR